MERDGVKSKRSKSEVKNVVNSYLQKRNYCVLQPFEVTQSQQVMHSEIENQVARSNSVSYSSSSTDPGIVDQNFTKFLKWLEEQKQQNLCHDLDQIVGPLFCHFYIEILKGDHNERGDVFLRNHSATFEANGCDPLIKNLIKDFKTDTYFSEAKVLFRSKKIDIPLSKKSLEMLKTFVREQCHVVFLQVLQNWFDFTISTESDSEEESDPETSSTDKKLSQGESYNLDYSSSTGENPLLNKLLQTISDLTAEPYPVYLATLGRSRHYIPTGIMRRQAGLVAFAEENVLNIMPLNSLDLMLNIRDHVERVRFTDHSSQIYNIDISYSNNLLATASSDQTACVYDLNEMKLLHKCEGHTGPVFSVKISPTSEYIATGSTDNTARLWETATGRTLRIFVAHAGPITCLDFHPNCLYLASGSSDRYLRMWCITKAVTLRLFHGHTAPVVAVAFNSAGKYLASSSEDRKIRIWDLLTSRSLLELIVAGAPTYRLIWNKTGRELCTGSNNGTVRIWNLGSIQDNGWENVPQEMEPTDVKKMPGRLISLEYAFGTYGVLTVWEK